MFEDAIACKVHWTHIKIAVYKDSGFLWLDSGSGTWNNEDSYLVSLLYCDVIDATTPAFQKSADAACATHRLRRAGLQRHSSIGTRWTPFITWGPFAFQHRLIAKDLESCSSLPHLQTPIQLHTSILSSHYIRAESHQWCYRRHSRHRCLPVDAVMPRKRVSLGFVM